ncbi:hypothetical protein ACFQ9Z_38380 [Streptomyces sp. NPDC056580]|uniref:hypothetical protein n=1 Tax=Streptomyces sp. NPDC056580 TaxID=3345872 RepID=UPI00367CC52E
MQEAIAQDAVAVTEAGREALELLAQGTETVPEDVAEALPRARQHTIEPLAEWKDVHRRPFGPQGNGAWVRLARHGFHLADGSTHSLWAVSDGRWAYGADADAGETTTAFLSAPAARSDWREARDAHHRPAPSTLTPAVDLPCPGQDVQHCHNCGSTTITPNEFLELGRMHASQGLACGPRCYDAVSDVPGRHAQRRHHAWTDR